MPTTYTRADADTMRLLEQAVNTWHLQLKHHKVSIGVLMAGNPDGPAVSHGGYPAAAKIKIVSLKDRLTKKFDAELIIDEDHWKSCSDEHKLALLDHELSHIEVAFNKNGGVKLDDLGRPKLKSVPGDIVQSDGFRDVIRRHREFAPEYINHRVAAHQINDAMDAVVNESAA